MPVDISEPEHTMSLMQAPPVLMPPTPPVVPDITLAMVAKELGPVLSAAMGMDGFTAEDFSK